MWIAQVYAEKDLQFQGLDENTSLYSTIKKNIILVLTDCVEEKFPSQ